ncbi:SAM-dependent methyltransferase [Cryptosporangium sp. NPDC048952]|uniref:SAM-dependent methyltransferase n=1 Tax=Cryptosporangium sp. NPDC048952 TaxID=3363961 RepID=UPI0037185327
MRSGHVSDEDDPARIVRSFVDALPSGSYLATASSARPDARGRKARRAAQALSLR